MRKILTVMVLVAAAVFSGACSEPDDGDLPIVDAGGPMDAEPDSDDNIACEADEWDSGGECVACVPRECGDIAANLSVDTASNRLVLDVSGAVGPPIVAAQAAGSVRLSGGQLTNAAVDADVNGATLVFDFSEYLDAVEIQVDFITLEDTCGEEELRPAVRWTPGGTSEIPGFCI